MMKKNKTAPGTYSRDREEKSLELNKLGQQPAKLNEGEKMDSVIQSHPDLSD